MGVRTMTVYVLGDGSGLSRTLNRATVDLDRFVASAEKKGGRLGEVLGSNLTKGVAVAAVGLAAGLGAAVAAAIPFEAAMHNVATLATDVQGNLAGASQAVLNLSTTVPQSATTLAKSLYEIESSNIKGADAFHVLDVSAKAATAGLSDADTASRAITAAINAYGLSAASAGDISDILFQTVNKGVVTFGDLAQNLGDFVGTAAAAKVPLQDVAAAYAAITLSGIPANEAATATNQLLTHLLKPSKDLAAVYKQLGYESGASALQQKGLAGVVRDLGKATGGSAAAITKMFGRVESSKALLALLAAGGKNYQSALDGITNASERTGATQRAFNEQMKSTSAQLTLFKNGAEAVAISVGLKLLPPLNAFLKAARDAGGDALPYIEAALHRVGPLFEQVWTIAGNLAKILLELAKDAAPFAQALAKMAAAVAIPPLMLFLNVLQSITGFLARHQEIVDAVAAVYLVKFIPALIDAGIGLAGIVTRAVLATVSLGGVGSAALGADIAMSKLNASMNLAASAGLAAAVFVAVRSFQGLDESAQKSAETMKKFRDDFRATDLHHTSDQITELTKYVDEGEKVAQEYGGAWGQVRAVFNQVAGDGSIYKVLKQGDDAKKTIQEFAAEAANANDNLTAVAHATGLTNAALAELAGKQNIDLSRPFDSSADARKRLIDYVHDLKHAQDVATASFVAGFGKDVEAAQEAEKAVKDFADAAQKAFSKDTDVLGKFDPAGDAKKVADAQTALAKARKESGGSAGSSLRDEQRIARDRQAIHDAEERAGVAHTKTLSGLVSRRQAIQRAQKRLADDQALIDAKGSGTGSGVSASVRNAQEALAKARADAANNSLESQYKRAIQLGKDFTRDINAAVQRGLDPTVIGKLLQEGPAQAEPALQRILADHSGNLIKMVNTSEAQIAGLTGYVAEQARIAARAMNAPTDQYTRELKTAMAIAAAEAASGGRATMASLVKSLHLPAAQIRRVATDFGITLADEVQGAVRKHGPITFEFAPSRGKNPSNVAQSALTAVLTGGQKRRAEGGPIDYGPYGRDQVPAWVTRGEWVQPKASVDYYGQAFHEAIRTRTFPKLWDGGLVGAGGALISSVLNVAGPRIVPVPVPVANRSSTDNSQTFNIDRVLVGSLDQVPATAGRTYSATRGVS